MEDFTTIKERSQIAVEDTWATEDLYPSDEAWKETLSTMETDKEKLISFAGHLAESAQTLYDYLHTTEQVNVKAHRLANYCMRKGDEDTRNYDRRVYRCRSGAWRRYQL